MKLSTLLAVFVVVISLVISGTAFAQLSDMDDRTSVFRRDVVGNPVLETLCHIPPGNPSNAHTIDVEQQDVAAHLAHGDMLGECPYECDGGVPAPVVQTGQIQCWNQVGGSIDCSGTGQDGEYQNGTPLPEPRFTDNGDGTVTDNLTSLIWLQDAHCWDPQKWIEALDTANGLADGSCGLTDGSVVGDWRLPNVRELHSLIDYGASLGHPFLGLPVFGSFVYWSSSTVQGDEGRAWRMDSHEGSLIGSIKGYTLFVWPVRGPE